MGGRQDRRYGGQLSHRHLHQRRGKRASLSDRGRLYRNAGAGVAPYKSVKFLYNTVQATRPDITPYYEAGSLQKTTVLLNRIQTFNGVSPGATTMVLDYRLDYEYGSPTTHSRLTSVTLCDGQGASCSPATTFGWQGSRDTVALTPYQDPQPAIAGSLGDFNGDGLSDLETSLLGNRQLRYGHADLTFGDAIALDCNPFYVAADIPMIGDINGDGYFDYFLNPQFGGGQGACINNRDGTYTAIAPGAMGLPSLQGLDYFGDYNGDGRMDGILSYQVSHGWYKRLLLPILLQCRKHIHGRGEPVDSRPARFRRKFRLRRRRL